MSAPPSSSAVEEVVRREVPDWDDEIASTARFKAFCGQRPDWENRYLFWRGLILKVARHLGVVSVRSSEVKSVWFTRGGLAPICIDRVLHEMYADGDIIFKGELIDPTSGRLYQLLRRVAHIVGISRSSLQENFEETLILKPLLEERATEIVNSLIELNWTSTCIITIEKFQSICKGSDDAAMLLSYLSACQKAQYFSIRKKDFIEGVKVSLVAGPVPSISSLDYDSLHLIWTTEKLQKQLDVIDRHWEISRKMALVSLKSGNKQAAYGHIRESKLFLETRAKCASLLERVEEVLGVIANAESTKKVSEAIQIGARAVKENNISVEEVYLHLQELDDNVAAQKQISEALGSMSVQSADSDDDDVEEVELSDKMPQSQMRKPSAQRVMELEQSVAQEVSEKIKAPEEAGESGVRLTEALANLNLEAA